MAIGDIVKWRFATLEMVRAWAGVAAEQLAALLANTTELHVLILFIDILVFWTIDLTMGTRPFTLWSLVKFWVQAAQVICSGASVTKNDFSSLLADLAIFLGSKQISWQLFKKDWSFN